MRACILATTIIVTLASFVTAAPIEARDAMFIGIHTPGGPRDAIPEAEAMFIGIHTPGGPRDAIPEAEAMFLADEDILKRDSMFIHRAPVSKPSPEAMFIHIPPPGQVAN